MEITTYQKLISGFDSAFSESKVVQASGSGAVSLLIPMGFLSEDFTYISSSAGTLVLSEDHPFETAQVVDLYWESGSRRGVTLGAVSGQTVPIASGGEGDNLPVSDTEIIVSERIGFTIGIPDTSDLVFVGYHVIYRGGDSQIPTENIRIALTGNGGTTDLSLEPNIATICIIAEDETELIESDYATGVISNPSSEVDGDFLMTWLIN
jgi:hypothetical protein